MPSLSDMRMVGQTCSAYEAEAEEWSGAVRPACTGAEKKGLHPRCFLGAAHQLRSNLGEGPWLAWVNQGLLFCGKTETKGV